MGDAQSKDSWGVSGLDAVAPTLSCRVTGDCGKVLTDYRKDRATVFGVRVER
jgi:hypothetical protein